MTLPHQEETALLRGRGAFSRGYSVMCQSINHYFTTLLAGSLLVDPTFLYELSGGDGPGVLGREIACVGFLTCPCLVCVAHENV